MNCIRLALMASTMIAGAAQAEEIILGHGANPGNPRFVAAERFAELVATCTNGETTVNVAPSATLGDDVELLTSATAGIVHITANSQGAVSQIVPEIGAIGLPFLFDSPEQALAVLDGEVGDLLDARAQEAGLKILSFWDNGIRHVSHLNKVLPTPADFAGMQIRTPPDEVTIQIFEALGASPAPLAFSELPTALQSGVFDGQENPLTNIYSSKIHEITPFITLTGHKYESSPLVAGLAWWSGLDEATQGCVQQAADEAGQYQRELSATAASDLRPTMEAEGVTFAEIEDRQAFIDATAPVYEGFEAQYPDLVAALREAAGQ